MNNEMLVKKVLEIDERLCRVEERVTTIERDMVTRDEFLSSHDEIMTILKRLDQERVVQNHRLDRIEARLSA